MRCPKCHYLGFDPEPRCKNCGYDLEVADADLALHTAEPADDEVPDLTLHERPSAVQAPVTLELVHAGAGSRTAVADRPPRPRRPRKPVSPPADPGSRFTIVEEAVDEGYEEPSIQLYEVAEEEPEATERRAEVTAAPEPAPVFDPAAFAAESEPMVKPEVPVAPAPMPMPTPFRAPHTTTDLPLFVKAIAENDLRAAELSLRDEIPLVPPTRPPLSVRRAAPEPVRAQDRVAERRLGPLDHDLLEDLKRVEREESARHREQPLRMTDTSIDALDSIDSGDDPVEPRLRLAAAGIDVAVLGGIAAFVFWATLRLCNVTVSDVGWAALVPFLIFIAVMDVSYLLMFTAAGGQTVGKMLVGIRVIGDDQPADEPVPMGRAAWRAVLTMVSVVALGLGWLPALFGRGLTLHDRLAHTRVVRA